MAVPGFQLADLRFAPGVELAVHAHEPTTLAVVLQGGFDGWWDGVDGSCPPGTLVVEPSGERHANRFSATAATRVVIVQPWDDPVQLWTARGRRASHRPDVVPIATRILRELDQPDSVSPMALQGLALELLASSERNWPAPGRRPFWLARAVEILEERYAEPLTLSGVAAELGVHPTHLARVFRRERGRSLGTYLREVRVRRAAEQLARGTHSIARIAHNVGFADQSHLTRWFSRSLGVTPAQYRQVVLERPRLALRR